MEEQNNINFDPKKGWERFSGRVEREQQLQQRRSRWIKYAAALFIPVMLVSGLLLTKHYQQAPENEALVFISSGIGEQKEVQLPDGSRVWLNAASEISYNFKNKKERAVNLLKGEAYFEVSHDQKKPFMVKVNALYVKVYGTGFNINSYDPTVKTTLIHGSIGAGCSGQHLMLKPGQEASFDTQTQAFKVKNVTINDFAAWRNGLLNFENASLREIGTILERQYGYTFSFSSSQIAEMRFTATAKIKEGLPQLLGFLNKVSGLQFKIINKTVLVSP